MLYNEWPATDYWLYLFWDILLKSFKIWKSKFFGVLIFGNFSFPFLLLFRIERKKVFLWLIIKLLEKLRLEIGHRILLETMINWFLWRRYLGILVSLTILISVSRASFLVDNFVGSSLLGDAWTNWVIFIEMLVEKSIRSWGYRSHETWETRL